MDDRFIDEHPPDTPLQPSNLFFPHRTKSELKKQLEKEQEQEAQSNNWDEADVGMTSMAFQSDHQTHSFIFNVSQERAAIGSITSPKKVNRAYSTAVYMLQAAAYSLQLDNKNTTNKKE